MMFSYYSSAVIISRFVKEVPFKFPLHKRAHSCGSFEAVITNRSWSVILHPHHCYSQQLYFSVI